MVESIANTSMSLSAYKIQMSASVSVTKKAMDQMEVSAQQLLEMIPSDPNLGQVVDISV